MVGLEPNIIGTVDFQMYRYNAPSDSPAECYTRSASLRHGSEMNFCLQRSDFGN